MKRTNHPDRVPVCDAENRPIDHIEQLLNYAEQILSARHNLPPGQKPPAFVNEFDMAAVTGKKVSRLRYDRTTGQGYSFKKDGSSVGYDWRKGLREDAVRS